LTEEVQRRRVRTRQVKRSVLDDDEPHILRSDEDDLTCDDGVNLQSRRVPRWRVPVFPSVPTTYGGIHKCIGFQVTLRFTAEDAVAMAAN
jgi:hypothetical protein